MAVMASRIIKARKNIKKKQRENRSTNIYDGYAIFCDQDRVKISNLLMALKLLDLRIHCKDDADLGDRLSIAVTDKGIFAAESCLLFVSNNFIEDSFCMTLLDLALVRYLETNRKYRIITICLDDTKIPFLKLFREIPIKIFSCGSKPDIFIDSRLLCGIYKAMKGPQLKRFCHNPKKHYCHIQYSSIKRNTKKFLKERKNVKLTILKYTYTLKGCQYVKLISLGYLICKCFFNSILWKKLISLVRCPQILPMIRRYLSMTIELQYQLTKDTCLLLHCQTELQKTKQSACKYCSSMVPASDLDQHENLCCQPVNCGSCGRVIAQAHKQKHELECIYEECFNCSGFHPSTHDCSNTTGMLEETDQHLQDDFSSLNSEVSLKFCRPPEVAKTVDQLLDVVKNILKQKKKSKIDNHVNELSNLVQQLLKQLKNEKLINQQKMNIISEIMSKELVSVEYSSRSINYFRNFIYAVELNCDFPLFDNKTLIPSVMCMSQPQPPQSKFNIFRRFRRQKSSPQNGAASEQVFFPLIKDLYK